VSADSFPDLWLRLLLVPELTKIHWYRLHQAFGSPDAILGAEAKEICQTARVGEEAARAILRGPDPDALEREKDLIAQTGATIITFDDELYPWNLRSCSAPPMLLYVLGELRADDRFAAVVVGSRKMTQYGKLATQNIVSELVGAGLTIVSGMAHGIDSVAHEAALQGGGRTIAVLAQGFAARESPHRLEMRGRIAEQGAVISEFPMTAAPERYHFPTRNHTMAALGLATVVVEAAEKSGALITAEHAAGEGRQVFAVPGDVTRETSRGTNELIRQGAALARSGRDIIEDMAPQLGALLREGKTGEQARDESFPPVSVSDTAQAVLEQIRPEPIHFDTLHERLEGSGITIGSLSAALLELEMKGLVRHLPGNLYMIGSVR